MNIFARQLPFGEAGGGILNFKFLIFNLNFILKIHQSP